MGTNYNMDMATLGTFLLIICGALTAFLIIKDHGVRTFIWILLGATLISIICIVSLMIISGGF